MTGIDGLRDHRVATSESGAGPRPEPDPAAMPRDVFRAIADGTTDAVYIKDLAGRYTYANPAAARWFHRSPEAMLGVTDADLMSPEEVASTAERDRAVLAAGQTVTYEDEQQLEGKRQVWLTTKGPLLDASGRTVGLFGISRDITARKLLEDAYRVTAERVRLVHEAAQLGSWDWTLATGETFWSAPPAPGEHSRPLLLRSGIEAAFLEQVHPDDQARVRSELEQLVRQPRAYAFEYRVLTARGEVRWQRSWGTVLRSEDGQVRMVGVLVDITERREIEDEHARLLRSEQTARREADAARAALALFDRASSELGSAPLDETARLRVLARLAVPELGKGCVLVAAAGDHRLQLTEPELLFPDGVPEPLSARCLQALSSGQDARIVSAEGLTDAAAWVILVPIRTPAHRFATLAVLSDARADTLPSLQALAQELGHRASHALENARLFRKEQEAVRDRDEVVAIVAHDLKNPLMAIQLLSDRVARLAGPGRDGDLLRRTAEQIRIQVATMENLVSDFLDVSVMEAGKLQLQLAPHAVGELVTDALQGVVPLARAKRITLRAQVAPGVGGVRCDRERLAQVFSNLLGNALKHTPEGGEIGVGADRLGDSIRFFVRDCGPGISPEVLERIFDRFYQTRRAHRANVGLGLTIAKGIVEAHGGRLWAESTPGRGATFFFTAAACETDVRWSGEVTLVEEPTRPPAGP